MDFCLDLVRDFLMFYVVSIQKSLELGDIGSNNMRIDCGKCGTNFELTERCIEKEDCKMNEFSKIAFKIFGMNFGESCTQYFVVCPICHRRVAKFTGDCFFN